MLLVQDQLSILELKRLLHAIKDLSPETGVRFRFMGEMWHPDFTRVASITEEGVTVYDERNNRYMLIQNFTYIMHFELDTPFQQYRPHFHYTIDTSVPD
jgi:hypothetical protein